MPKKGTKIKAPRQVGVNKTQLKKDGFAHDPPIPYNQFGGNTKQLRQFKAFYQPDGKGRKDKQLKGLLKDMESGRLYLANEDKTSYVELTEEQYDNIVKEIGERVGIDGGEPRVGKPYQGRTKDQEVIEEEEEEEEEEVPAEEDYDFPKEFARARKEAASTQPFTEENLYVGEVEFLGKTIYINNNRVIYDPVRREEIGIIDEIEDTINELDTSTKFGSYFDRILDEPEPDIPEGSESEAEEDDDDTDELDYTNLNEVNWAVSDLERGNFKVSNLTARFIPSLDRREDEELFPEFFTYRWRDVWWVLNQTIDAEGNITNHHPRKKMDDEFYFDYEEAEEDEEDEVTVVGIRAMRGRRRVLLVKPPSFTRKGDDTENTIYIYDAGAKYYGEGAVLIGKENYGDDENEITSEELTPINLKGADTVNDIIFGYIENPFKWYDDEDDDGAYSEDEMGFGHTEPDDLELLNPPNENEIEEKDADYIVDLSDEFDDPTLSVLRIQGGSSGYDEDEDEVWINKFKEFTTEGKLRAEIFNELVEEILSGEVDEIVRAKILEEMGVIDSKKKPDMVVFTGKKSKLKVKKKELTQKQLDALAAARAIRKTKKDAN